LSNVYFLHFEKLKNDLPGEIRRLAAFLEIPVKEDKWEAILEHCSFAYMKANATKSVPLGGAFWDGGAETFIHKGTNGRWREVLKEDEILKYEKIADAELEEACARWLATGKYPGEAL